MMNGLQTLTEWQKFFNTPFAPILGTINAMYPVGKVFGVFASAFVGDRYGEKSRLGCWTVLLTRWNCNSRVLHKIRQCKYNLFLDALL
jgi:hypothetical protein